MKIEYVRDGKSQIVGSKTTGFANGDTVAQLRLCDGRDAQPITWSKRIHLIYKALRAFVN